MSRITVKELKPKAESSSTFYVKYLALAEAKDGKKYLNIILSDATGDMESRIWHGAEDIYARIEKGNFVAVSGKVNLYQGRKQFIVSSINKIEESEVELSDFVAASDIDPDEMYTELLSKVEGLEDVYIKELLFQVLRDTEIARRLKKWQAGKSIHHAYHAGLLEHILSCTNLALHLSPIYKVNTSYVVAGAILHDICKIYELTDDINVEYTEEGKLVGHLAKGPELVDRFAYRIKDFPYQMKLHLKHILLSHHGEYAYGSPKIPQTSEAMLVHLIDLMDSKMHSFETVKKNDNNSGHWTSFVKHLDRIVYKGELPTFKTKLAPSTKQATREAKNADDKPKQKPPRKHVDKELKQSLGDALKDFKVSE